MICLESLSVCFKQYSYHLDLVSICLHSYTQILPQNATKFCESFSPKYSIFISLLEKTIVIQKDQINFVIPTKVN